MRKVPNPRSCQHVAGPPATCTTLRKFIMGGVGVARQEMSGGMCPTPSGRLQLLLCAEYSRSAPREVEE